MLRASRLWPCRVKAEQSTSSAGKQLAAGGVSRWSQTSLAPSPLPRPPARAWHRRGLPSVGWHGCRTERHSPCPHHSPHRRPCSKVRALPRSRIGRAVAGRCRHRAGDCRPRRPGRPRNRQRQAFRQAVWPGGCAAKLGGRRGRARGVALVPLAPLLALEVHVLDVLPVGAARSARRRLLGRPAAHRLCGAQPAAAEGA